MLGTFRVYSVGNGLDHFRTKKHEITHHTNRHTRTHTHFLSADKQKFQGHIFGRLMCGILFYLTKQQKWLDDYNELVPFIKNRGPSYSGEYTTITSNGYSIKCFSSVLSLRLPFTAQPLTINDSCLQFNGEIYRFGVEIVKDNDTHYVFDKFRSVGVLKSLQLLQGEYALCYYEQNNNKVWFARDCIGRRSLMYRFDENEGLFVSSVSPKASARDFLEVEGGKVYCYDIILNSLQTYSWGQGDTSDLVFPYSDINLNVLHMSQLFAYREEFEGILQEAVKQRLETIPMRESGRLAILFSGGLDCTLLAALVDTLLKCDEQVDLLNVAFENKRIGGGYDTPDRILGRRSWTELDCISKTKNRFRFVEIDVPYEETVANRPVVQDLMWPKDSVMDLSIAVAFYFASKGKGRVYEMNNSSIAVLLEDSYTSSCPVLFSGLGADELFGGYSRHGMRIKDEGYESLARELQLDFDRLHERNLGRDDRVCACWGKELRYPFLDENVVNWTMNKCPLNYKVCTEPNIEGKCILRNIAYNRGLKNVSLEKKRAIQFGARSAKMEAGQGKIKGTDKLI